MTLAPRLRKAALTAHLAASVGWVGAVAVFLVLAVAGLTSSSAETVRAAYLAMELTAWFAIVPLALASLVTGLVQSLGTAWGLYRHYWVVVKLGATLLALVVLLVQLQPIGLVADAAAETTLARGDLRPERVSLALHAGGGLAVLLVPLVLGVFKPRGLTRHGRRKRDEALRPAASERSRCRGPSRLAPMVPEAPLERTDAGLVAKGDGWFVLNAKDARWYHADGRAALCDLEGDVEFPQLGVNITVLGPGEPMAMYHWEADQEDFLVLSGEALLIVEGEERPLRQWDFVHCPPETKHVIVGAGAGPCVVVAVGARDRSVDNPEWGGYTVDETALRHGAGVERETNEPQEAYAGWTRRQPTGYRREWLGQPSPSQ